MLDVNQWVAVIYDDVWWPGVIQAVHEERGSYKINFMKPVGDNKFIWPEEIDVAQVSQAEILQYIPMPPPL